MHKATFCYLRLLKSCESFPLANFFLEFQKFLGANRPSSSLISASLIIVRDPETGTLELTIFQRSRNPEHLFAETGIGACKNLFTWAGAEFRTFLELEPISASGSDCSSGPSASPFPRLSSLTSSRTSPFFSLPLKRPVPKNLEVTGKTANEFGICEKNKSKNVGSFLVPS